MGAGTCQLSNYLAIGTNNKIYAMDTTMESLKLGKQFSDKNYIKNITYIKADLFDEIFDSKVFDLVWCSGVLHHTKEPYKGFKNILNYLKNNGYVIIGLYNKIFRVKTAIRRFLFKIFGKGIVLILDPHLRKIKNEKDKVNSWINDQYKHPVESTHTFDEVLKWFNDNNIEFINSIPSIQNLNDGDLFKKKEKGDIISRFLVQIFSIFTPLADEGGLFIMIGKKMFNNFSKEFLFVKFPIIFSILYFFVLFYFPNFETLLIFTTILILAEPHFGATWPFF